MPIQIITNHPFQQCVSEPAPIVKAHEKLVSTIRVWTPKGVSHAGYFGPEHVSTRVARADKPGKLSAGIRRRMDRLSAAGRVWLVTLYLLPLLFCGNVFANDVDAQFEKQMADYWEQRLQASPLFASAVGDERFNSDLDDLSEQAFARRIRDLDQAIESLSALQASSLTKRHQVNHKVYQWILKYERERLNYPWHYVTLNSFSGWHIRFALTAEASAFTSEKNYRDYIKRLNQFGRYADQNMALMRKGIEAGYVQPCASMAGYDKTISDYITDKPEASVFFTPFRHIPKKYGVSTIKALQSEASQAIIHSVMPAYQRYWRFFKETYQPACRQLIGLSALPQGRELYDHFVRYYTSVDTTADSVHQLGLSEVERIRKEMSDIIHSLDFQGDFSDFLTFLRTDEQFYPKNSDSYLTRAATIAKQIDGKLPEYFSYLPRISYGILPVDDAIAPKMPFAYAQGASADRTRAGQFRLNTFNLPGRPLYGLPSLTLHEAMPGHILQFAIQNELENLPDVRRYSHFIAYVEGWALYAEKVGEDMGVYKTPYEHFGRLVYEMWRACRLVVDSGIHAKGWTRQQAIEFMAENTALNLPNIEVEVDRYITYPGQALSYKYGERTIVELRKRAEKSLGSAFSLRDFHTVILTSGSLPLAVLEDVVNDWIDRAQEK